VGLYRQRLEQVELWIVFVITMMLNVFLDDLGCHFVAHSSGKVAILPPSPPQSCFLTWGCSRKIARALRLLKRVTTWVMDKGGGKEQKICTWSWLTSISSPSLRFFDADVTGLSNLLEQFCHSLTHR